MISLDHSSQLPPLSPSRVGGQDDLSILPVAAVDEGVQEGAQSQRGLGHLDLDNGLCALKVAAGFEVRGVDVLRVDVVAVPLVGVHGPLHGALHGGARVGAGDPVGRGREEGVLADAVRQAREEGVDGLVGEAGRVGGVVDERAVPDGVQDRVVGQAAVGDLEGVAALANVRGVQRLCEIADEMGHKLERVGAVDVGAVGDLALLCAVDAVSQDHRLVGDGGHDAAALGAVTVVERVANCGRLVVTVDPVPLHRICALWRTTVRICPCCCTTDGARVGGIQDALHDFCCLMTEKTFSHEANLVVDISAPCCGCAEEQRGCREEGGGEVHLERLTLDLEMIVYTQEKIEESGNDMRYY